MGRRITRISLFHERLFGDCLRNTVVEGLYLALQKSSSF